jgi:olefin beta-lactone synthetase
MNARSTSAALRARQPLADMPTHPEVNVTPGNANLFLDLAQFAARMPNKPAIVTVEGRDAEHRPICAELDYRELCAQVEQCSAGLAAQGIHHNMRVMLLVMPGRDFVVIVHALIRLGAVIVFIDPGHPLERLLALIKEAEPQALIAIPLAFMLKATRPEAFASVAVSIVVGGTVPSASEYAAILGAAHPPSPTAPVALDDTMMIAFTSGSTGLPKGVEFTPRMIRAMTAEQRTERYGWRQDDVDLTMFPIMLIALPTVGMTMVLPEIDATAPGKVDPAGVVALILARECTTSIGSSPVFWGKIADYCVEKQIVLPSLRSVLLSGAPVSTALLRRLRDVIPNAACHTPIGSTECGSVASIEAAEVLSETGARTEQGAGICIGRPFADHPVGVIALTDDPLPTWEAARPRKVGEIGEIVVRGPGASPRYFRRPDATLRARIRAGDGAVWHRTGDVGYLDEQGRLWFCGRASQIIEHEGKFHYPVMVESVVNADPSVFRSGLVKAAGALVLCVEFRPDVPVSERASKIERIQARTVALNVPVRHVLIHDEGFPVDARHNAKIDYPALSEWAARRLERG